MTITIKKIARRFYLMGNTYPLKDAIRDAGCHWDADQKAWWTAKEEVATRLAHASPTTNEAGKAPGKAAIVAGRSLYKGKHFYVAGKRTGYHRYEQGVEMVTSRDGAKILLFSLDGSFQFWADRTLVTVARHYSRPQTIQGLEDYRKEMSNPHRQPSRSELYQQLEALDDQDEFEAARDFARKHGLKY
jgi:hypothetical protein